MHSTVTRFCLLLFAASCSDPLVGAGTRLEWQPRSYSFPQTAVGSTATAELVLKNSGSRAVQVTAVKLAAGGSAAFTLLAGGFTAARTLQPRQEVVVMIRYAPTTLAEARAILRAETVSGPAEAVLTNLPPAPRIELEPAFVDFGVVAQGQRAEREVKVRNVGTAPLTVPAMALSAATPADFGLDLAGTALPVTLDLLQVRSVKVTFTPRGVGARTGGLEVASDDSRSPIATVALSSGESNPRISVDPLELRFGDVEQGQSRALTVRVTNAGTAALQFTPSVTGSADFRAPGVEQTAAPNATVDVAVTYAPSNAGTDAGALVLAHNDPTQGPVEVALLGGAEPSIALSPFGIQFSNVAQFSMKDQEVIVTNAGYGELVLGAIVFGTDAGESHADYTLRDVPASGTALRRGQTARFTVRYQKSTVGNPTAVVYVASNDPESENPFPIYVVSVDGIADPPPTAAIACSNCNGSTIQGTPPLPVQLDGSGSSDPQGQPLGYSWSLSASPSGSQAVIESPLAETTRFTADLAGVYRVTLLVQDSSGQQSPRAMKDITLVP